MKTYEDVKEFVKSSNGIISTKGFVSAKINRYQINKLIQDGIIEKIESGLYLRHDTIEDMFFILQSCIPTVIFSYNSAIYLHNLAERTPVNISVTVYKGYNASHLTNKATIHYVNKENHKLGTTILKTPQGYDVVTYDLERITCDLIRTKNTGLDIEQRNKFLRTVFLENKLDTIKLVEYSKKLTCENKVRNFMEVFI